MFSGLIPEKYNIGILKKYKESVLSIFAKRKPVGSEVIQTIRDKLLKSILDIKLDHKRGYLKENNFLKPPLKQHEKPNFPEISNVSKKTKKMREFSDYVVGTKSLSYEPGKY